MFRRHQKLLSIQTINNQDICFHEGKRVIIIGSIEGKIKQKVRNISCGGARSVAYSLKK